MGKKGLTIISPSVSTDFGSVFSRGSSNIKHACVCVFSLFLSLVFGRAKKVLRAFFCKNRDGIKTLSIQEKRALYDRLLPFSEVARRKKEEEKTTLAYYDPSVGLLPREEGRKKKEEERRRKGKIPR